MNNKQLGIILIVAGMLIACLVYVAKVREDRAIEQIIVAQGGSCYLADGTCLHEDRDLMPFIIGWIVAGALAILGIYLLLAHQAHAGHAAHERHLADSLKEAKRHEKEKDEFGAFLAAFTPDEQLLIKVIKDQEGILQSTLRFKTGLSKTAVSLMLGDLEKRSIISRKTKGKSNQVFLRKKF